MRLLSEHMSLPEMNSAAFPAAGYKNKVVIQDSKPEETEVDTVENRNLKLAREVDVHKTRLIQVLSRFPLTALSLIKKYERSSSESDLEEESVGAESSTINDSINSLKTQFALSYTHHSQRCYSESDLCPNEELASSIKQFPFAFDDLVYAVDLIVRVFKSTNVTWVPNVENKKEQRIILSRVTNNSLCNQANATLQLKGLNLENYSESFLIGMSKDLNELLIEMMLSEHRWLFYRQQLATVNSKLVLFIANQYKGNFLDFDDLVQEGHSGLLKAVDRFKYQLGFQFSTYAGYWIRQAISRALSRCERVVRIPCGQIATINKVFRTKDELTLKTGKEPTIQNLAEHTHLTQDEINTILSISQTAVPLESFNDEEEDTFAPIDFIEQKVFTDSSVLIADSQLESLVNTAIKSLNSREAKIISSHFGVGDDTQLTLQEIGSELNLTRERVRQIQVVGLNKIRMRYGEQLLSFL